MQKPDSNLKLIVLALLSLMPFLLSGCATEPVARGANWEPWAGRLTGMVEADLTMYFSRLEQEEGAFLVEGSFSGDIEDVSGGYGSGTMSGDIRGQVKDGIFNVRIRGHARVRAGSAAVDGKLLGTLSQTQAFGTWNLEARDSEETYRFAGEWNADKVDAASQVQ